MNLQNKGLGSDLRADWPNSSYRGYGIDVLGEAGVLAFTFGQTGNKGWAMLVFLNWLTEIAAARINGVKVAWEGYRRGRRAQRGLIIW